MIRKIAERSMYSMTLQTSILQTVTNLSELDKGIRDSRHLLELFWKERGHQTSGGLSYWRRTAFNVVKTRPTIQTTGSQSKL